MFYEMVRPPAERKCQMVTLRLLKRDIRLGIINRSYLFLIAAVFSLVTVSQCSELVRVLNELGFVKTNVTVMDYVIYSLQGVPFYNFNSSVDLSNKMIWFVFQMGLSYLIAYYAENDYSDNGVNVMTACRCRASWWLSKTIWCVLSVILYYLVTFTFCVIFALIKGASLSLDVTGVFLEAVFGYAMRYISYGDLILIAVIVPIAVNVGICLVQLLLSFLASPVMSFAILCGFYILSAYHTAWYLPASYTCWLRSSYYCENGLNPLSGLLIAAFLVFAVVLSGKAYFEQKDII